VSKSIAEVERPDDLIPLREAARRLGLSTKTLYNRCVEGHVEYHVYKRPNGVRGRLSIPVFEIERLKAESRRPRVLDSAKPKKRGRR
jgi:hypothetical protein